MRSRKAFLMFPRTLTPLPRKPEKFPGTPETCNILNIWLFLLAPKVPFTEHPATHACAATHLFPLWCPCDVSYTNTYNKTNAISTKFLNDLAIYLKAAVFVMVLKLIFLFLNGVCYHR
jgi:hypothetical protein